LPTARNSAVCVADDRPRARPRAENDRHRRRIGKRPPVDADWDAVFAACARTGTALEIDAFPDRLDLPADLIRLALRHGAVFAIDTDSHATRHLAHLRYGVATAQRGWLTPDNVINTWPPGQLLEFLHSKRPATPLR